MRNLNHPSPNFNDAKMRVFAPSSLVWGMCEIIVSFYSVQHCSKERGSDTCDPNYIRNNDVISRVKMNVRKGIVEDEQRIDRQIRIRL